MFGAPLRAPTILFNEKVMAGLGKGLSENRGLSEGVMRDALRVLTRFKALAAGMGISQPLTVATAAVRQANNGSEFLSRIREAGLHVTMLSGDEEAEAAGLGVIAGFESADGIVGDLGGGSLELVRIQGGRVHERESFPLGVLRLGALRAQGPKAFEIAVTKQLSVGGWIGAGKGLPFYLVGGSWRSLARIHMHLERFPLPVLHHYEMPRQAASRLVRAMSRLDLPALKAQGIVAGARLPALPDAAALLSVLMAKLDPANMIVSANGLREGLLFGRLSAADQQLDPLIVAARAEGQRQGRFTEHGDQLFNWTTPLFTDETKDQARLRHATCLLGDIGWAANPDFRAERGLESALHGNWLGLTPRGRAMIGQALYAAFGGGPVRPPILNELASDDELNVARIWGLAIRLGHRLGGGVSEPLAQSALSIAGDRLLLLLAQDAGALIGEAVERRLKQLAIALGKTGSLKVA